MHTRTLRLGFLMLVPGVLLACAGPSAGLDNPKRLLYASGEPVFAFSRPVSTEVRISQAAEPRGNLVYLLESRHNNVYALAVNTGQTIRATQTVRENGRVLLRAWQEPPMLAGRDQDRP